MTKKTKFDFQKNYDALERITNDFEAGKYNLEEGLTKFEEGLKLARELKVYLAEVNQSVQTIKGKYRELTSESKTKS
ncbi:MAG: exodeoxyribonuclease VII small subunit [Patescibacteria group bacterium]|jgi:exodeoxyribonuclease VII small subunit